MNKIIPTFKGNITRDIAFIVCSLLFLEDILPPIILYMVMGVAIILVVCFFFNIQLPIYRKKRRRKNKQDLSQKQKNTRLVISKIMDIVTTLLYALLIIYTIFRIIDISLFQTIIAYLYWTFFILYFVLRLVCIKMRID